MSKKPAMISKQPDKKEKKEWPAIVYIWAFGLGFVSYLVAEAVFRTSEPQPHSLALRAGWRDRWDWHRLAVVSLARRCLLERAGICPKLQPLNYLNTKLPAVVN